MAESGLPPALQPKQKFEAAAGTSATAGLPLGAGGLSALLREMSAASVASPVVFWLTAWFALNIGLTILNKYVMFDFPYPLTLTLVHMVGSAVLCYLSLPYYVPQRRQLTPAETGKLAAFSVLFLANIVVGNWATMLSSVSLVQIVRSMIPAITVVLSQVVLFKTYSRQHYAALVPLCLGVALASYGEHTDPNADFSMVGFILTLVVCFLSSLKSVVTAKFLVGNLRFHPIELLYWMSTLAIVQLMVLCLVSGEFARIAARSSELLSPGYLAFLAFNGVIAFALNISNFQFTKVAGALTVTVAGNVKHVATIILSVLVFGNHVSFTNGFGILVAVVGAALYSVVEYREQQNKKPGPSSSSSSSTSAAAASSTGTTGADSGSKV